MFLALRNVPGDAVDVCDAAGLLVEDRNRIVSNPEKSALLCDDPSVDFARNAVQKILEILYHAGNVSVVDDCLEEPRGSRFLYRITGDAGKRFGQPDNGHPPPFIERSEVRIIRHELGDHPIPLLACPDGKIVFPFTPEERAGQPDDTEGSKYAWKEQDWP